VFDFIEKNCDSTMARRAFPDKVGKSAFKW
jgi:hypothetical protein